MTSISEWAKRRKQRRLRQREEEPVAPVRAWGSGYDAGFGYSEAFAPHLATGRIEEAGWVEPACEPVRDTGTYSEPVRCDPDPRPPSYDSSPSYDAPSTDSGGYSGE